MATPTQGLQIRYSPVIQIYLSGWLSFLLVQGTDMINLPGTVFLTASRTDSSIPLIDHSAGFARIVDQSVFLHTVLVPAFPL
jgi:hypothetical protein